VTAGFDQRWVVPAGFLLIAAMLGALAGFDPKLAIGGSLAIAFVLLAFTNLAAGLVVFTFLTFAEFALPLGAASITKAAGLLLTLAWLAKVATDRDAGKTFLQAHPVETYLILAFLGWGAFSISWTETTAGTLDNLSRYFLNFTVVVITYTAYRRREDINFALLAWVAGTFFTAAYGLVGSPPTAGPDDVRLASTVGDANELAMVLVGGAVLSIAVAATAKHSPLLRLGASTTAVLALFALVLTGSRSGALALGAAVITTVLVSGRGSRVKALLAAGALSMTAIVFFVAFAPPTIKERITQTLPGQVPNTEGRSTIWQVGWRMAEDNPVRGVGLGSFETSSIHYVLEPGTLERSDQVIDTPKVAHNIYLQVFAELGLVGLVMLVSILAFPVVCALRAARRFATDGNASMSLISRAIVVALAAFYTSNFFLSSQFDKQLWLLIALGPVMLGIARQAQRSPGTAAA
jgi:putative inorganic carbon (HCO3(-)) transporter